MQFEIIDDNPTGWSDAKLEAHARRWCGLPTVQCKAVMTDDDAEAHGDLIYLRGLLDDIHGLCIDTGARIPARGLVEFDVDVYVEPWPQDKAGELLKAWRAESAS